MGYQHLTHFDEDSDDLDARFYGPRRFHDISSHDYTVLGEGEGRSSRMFQAIEPVTNCDQFGLFFRRKPKGEIHRKAIRVSFDGLIQGLRRDAVYFSQVCVDDYAMAPNR